jgi:hypothetical protein
MVSLSTNRSFSAKALPGAMFGGLVCLAASIDAQNAGVRRVINDLEIELGGD